MGSPCRLPLLRGWVARLIKPTLWITAGLAEIVAGSIAMGLGGYLCGQNWDWALWIGRAQRVWWDRTQTSNWNTRNQRCVCEIWRERRAAGKNWRAKLRRMIKMGWFYDALWIGLLEKPENIGRFKARWWLALATWLAAHTVNSIFLHAITTERTDLFHRHYVDLPDCFWVGEK